VRGEILKSNDVRLVVTIHPFYILRIKDEETKQEQSEGLIADLKFGMTVLGADAR
jgi:hypothetical protein